MDGFAFVGEPSEDEIDDVFAQDADELFAGVPEVNTDTVHENFGGASSSNAPPINMQAGNDDVSESEDEYGEDIWNAQIDAPNVTLESLENEKNEKVRERRKVAAQKRAKVVTARKVAVLCYAARVRWLSSLADNEFLQYIFLFSMSMLCLVQISFQVLAFILTIFFKTVGRACVSHRNSIFQNRNQIELEV